MQIEIKWHKDGFVEVNGYGLNFIKDGETQILDVDE